MDHNVGFDITHADRCYEENEVIEPTDGWQHPQVSSGRGDIRKKRF